ncbi:hypothetical protein P4T08_18125 [Bacillus siamensis]|uniref:hypothetical protein n=1 Tax=Bacillus siamensis TaxID=659243 RepID=UPI002E20721F|nr:hypothetical protein [Bacillus siamensis]
MSSFEELARENEKIARRKAKRIQRAREYTYHIELSFSKADPKLKSYLTQSFDQLRKILKNDDKEDNKYNI